MKKMLLSIFAMLSVSLAADAVEYIDWVDWDKIQHWAGDPDGENKCALVIDFQDEYDTKALVWGFRWNGTATGEDLVRAVASQSSALTAMVQYTGTMGSTLNGLGISAGREHLQYLRYDFESTALEGQVSFGYFTPNTGMGQDTAPGNEALDMCIQEIDRARETGIIEHPLNAFVYGYPAYDYDFWQLEEGYSSYENRWRSGWYDGYWSYWHGPNDYEYMGYSGLGMSSVILSDGCVQAWKWISFTGAGIGELGGELAEDLDYALADYNESMHEAPEVVQPVDQDDVTFWVGEGEKSATVVFQFNDGRGPENLVYGYHWTGGWDDDLKTVITNIANADPRMTYVDEGGVIKITYDSDCDGAIGTRDHSDTENTWNFYVKRVVDDKYNKVPGSRWLNPNAVMILSHQEADMASVELPYQLFRPALNDTEPSITLPKRVDYALADEAIQLPMFLQAPEGSTFNTSFTWTRDTNLTGVTTGVTTSNFMGYFSNYKDFAPTEGVLSVRGSYKPSGSTSSVYVYSNEMAVSLKNPVKPITSLSYERESVDARLSHEVENNLVYEPADATYTKINYASSATSVATVTTAGVVKTTKTAGEATITATYNIGTGVAASFDLTSSLVEPVTDVTFDCVDEEGYITLTPKEMAGLLPILTPADPDINTVTITLSDNGTDKDNYIATTYTVNLWDENGTRFQMPELSGHRVGECQITVTADDGGGFEKVIPVRIVEPERETPIDYNTGTIMLNEEWFGHTNGGLNWYSPDYEVVYQAYERENPGMSFGAASQYGIIYDGKLIVSSKQAVDGGDPLPGGGRLVVADAATLRRLGSIDDIMYGDETSSKDGRSLVGAGAGRVYMGTNSGIYIIDLNTVEIIGKVGSSDSDGSLYSGQIGDMVLGGHYVFATHQSTGLYVIDIETDEVVKFIADTKVQGVTQSADGSVWYATIDDNSQSNFVALDINTLEEVDRVVVPAEYGTVTCGWGAWRTTQFTGAYSVNSLFFCPGSSISNGGGGVIYRYDIDDEKFTRLAQVSGLPAHTPGVTQGAYGTIRYDDRTGEIIAGTTEQKASGHYRWNWTHFIDAETGEFNHTVELRPYYWFQAHAIFPDAYEPEVENIDDLMLNTDSDPYELIINATDPDNNDANIRYSLLASPAQQDGEESADAVEVTIEGNKLTITPKAEGEQTIGFAVESNGRVVTRAFNVSVNIGSGVEDVTYSNGRITSDGSKLIVEGYAGVTFRLVNMAGSKVDAFTASTDRFIRETSLPQGVYIIMGDNGVSKKIIIK